MKNLLILYLMLWSHIAFSQHIKKDVYEVHNCQYNQKGGLNCNKQTVNYQIIINNDLQFIYLLDKSKHDKVFSMDIKNITEVNTQLFIYDLKSGTDNSYTMSFDLKRQIIIIFPIHKINTNKINLSSLMLRFKNQTKI